MSVFMKNLKSQESVLKKLTKQEINNETGNKLRST